MHFALRMLVVMLTIGVSASAQTSDSVSSGKYAFDGKISREVLDNYLARSLHMSCLAEFVGRPQFDEDLRMVKNVGAKQLGRVAGVWWDSRCKVNMDAHLARAKEAAERLHKEDPEFMLQACIFETVGSGINKIPVSAWVFEEFEQFRRPSLDATFEDMLYDESFPTLGKYLNTPDISKLETRMWFYYCCSITTTWFCGPRTSSIPRRNASWKWVTATPSGLVARVGSHPADGSATTSPIKRNSITAFPRAKPGRI
ncbi:hypothetical protein ACFL1X_12925 [Candidatus Hydrogenedentota bacterium]